MRLTLAVVSYLAMTLAFLSVSADEKGSAPSRPESLRKGPADHTPPYPHYWDSNQWESVTGPDFWHSGSRKSPPSTKSPSPRPDRSVAPRKAGN